MERWGVRLWDARSVRGGVRRKGEDWDGMWCMVYGVCVQTGESEEADKEKDPD